MKKTPFLGRFQAYYIKNSLFEADFKSILCLCMPYLELRDGSSYQIGRTFWKIPNGLPPHHFGKLYCNLFQENAWKTFIKVQNLQYKFLDYWSVLHYWSILHENGPPSPLLLWNVSKNSSDLVAWPVPKGWPPFLRSAFRGFILVCFWPHIIFWCVLKQTLHKKKSFHPTTKITIPPFCLLLLCHKMVS